MRTLYVHNANDLSGSTRVLCDVIAERENGGEVTVLARNDGSGLLDDAPGVRVVNTYFRPTVFGHRILVVSELIRRIYAFAMGLKYGFKCDEVYVNTIMPCDVVLAARLLRKKITYHVHEYFVTPTPLTKRAVRIFRATKADRIYVSDYLRGCYPDDGNAVSVRYNRMAPDFVANIRITPMADRKLDTVLMISAPTAEKGADLFVRLASMLPQYSFVFVSGEPEERTKAFLGASLPPNLAVHCHPDSVQPFLESSDIFVSLTRSDICVETFGMALLEAMSYALPVIAPCVGGPVEVVADAGILMDVTDLPAVAEKIREILSDKELYAVLSSKALSKSKQFQ